MTVTPGTAEQANYLWFRLGAPGRIRTRDPLLRRQPLCPLSYRRSVTHCA
jgi:hypothetical protein